MLLVGEPRDIGRLQVINEQFKNKLSVLQKFDADILTLCETDDLAREIDESETINATVIDYKRRIDACLKPPPALETMHAHNCTSVVCCCEYASTSFGTGQV